MKILIIENCRQCKNKYINYLPDGKIDKSWCSLSNKPIIDLNIIAEHCKLDDINSIYQTEPDFNPNDIEPINDNN